jgi:dienelactone hydrolase
MRLASGATLGPYEISAIIGSGGMGEVYRARDTRLNRTVAIKIVRPDLAWGDEIGIRLRHEARAISALKHPHVCALYDIGEQDGLHYFVMEFVEGESLSRALQRGPLPLETAIRYGAEIASALDAAHSQGFIHRDVKPGNVMISSGGIKVLDFGLAKHLKREGASDAATMTLTSGLHSGLVGTVAYMSPEQADGRTLDARSDIFSLGVVLYEMVCGQTPFRGETTLSTLASILREDPPGPRQLRSETPAELDRIIQRCLAKKPEDRYGSAAEAARDLEKLRTPAATGITVRKSAVVAVVLLLVALLAAGGIRTYRNSSRARWAETEAIPQASQLMERSELLAARLLLRQAEKYAPSNPNLVRLKEDLGVTRTAIQTTPDHAEIFVTDYADPKADDRSHWLHLGRSPVETDQLPRRGYYRVRAVKDGFEPVEWTMLLTGGADRVPVPLHTKAETPAGMVWIPSAQRGPIAVMGLQAPQVPIPSVWMDKYEVTNREFKAFVDAGGYHKSEYWKHPFIKDGKPVDWKDAMLHFRDAAGRLGPSTWAGTYPDGKADFPVGGVSWFEAAAYAEFAGKSLPTVYHWAIAAGFDINSQILPLSNFGGQSPVRAGATLGMARYGTYDMAGNMKEWTANSSGLKQVMLGGAWNESSYMFQQPDLRSAWDREASFGFRCVQYPSPVPEALNGPVAMSSVERKDAPVDDRTFQTFQSSLTYDKTDLNAKVGPMTDAPHWSVEDVSFQAAYGNERVILHLYLPKDAKPPYQAVFFFGGNNMLFVRSREEVSNRLMEYIIKSGRAVVLPAYAGTLERGETPLPTPPGLARDLAIQQLKDVSRTVDYLQTRHDIDVSKLAFYGVSYGTGVAVRSLATDPRFKTAVLLSAGTRRATVPIVDTWNYLPRVKVPVLMINGQNDSLSPIETSQKPFFKALGTSEKEKKHRIFPGGHVDYIDRTEVIKEALDWLDLYLGSVGTVPQ